MGISPDALFHIQGIQSLNHGGLAMISAHW